MAGFCRSKRAEGTLALGPLNPCGYRFAQALFQGALLGLGIVFQAEHVFDVEGIDHLLAKVAITALAI